MVALHLYRGGCQPRYLGQFWARMRPKLPKANGLLPVRYQYAVSRVTPVYGGAAPVSSAKTKSLPWGKPFRYFCVSVLWGAIYQATAWEIAITGRNL